MERPRTKIAWSQLLNGDARSAIFSPYLLRFVAWCSYMNRIAHLLCDNPDVCLLAKKTHRHVRHQHGSSRNDESGRLHGELSGRMRRSQSLRLQNKQSLRKPSREAPSVKMLGLVEQFRLVKREEQPYAMTHGLCIAAFDPKFGRCRHETRTPRAGICQSMEISAYALDTHIDNNKTN